MNPRGERVLVFLGDAGLSLRWAGEDITLTLSGAVESERSPLPRSNRC